MKIAHVIDEHTRRRGLQARERKLTQWLLGAPRPNRRRFQNQLPAQTFSNDTATKGETMNLVLIRLIREQALTSAGEPESC